MKDDFYLVVNLTVWGRAPTIKVKHTKGGIKHTLISRKYRVFSDIILLCGLQEGKSLIKVTHLKV